MDIAWRGPPGGGSVKQIFKYVKFIIIIIGIIIIIINIIIIIITITITITIIRSHCGSRPPRRVSYRAPCV